MKKKVFSLMMMLVLAFMGIARADELTVNDGTTTNGFVPVYGFYADAYLKCEFVQPAADLAAMNGGDINGMTFYASQESVSWGAANFQVFLTEVADASISAFAGPGTVVYEGALSISGGLMNVAFTTPYHYNGGNLLVGVYNTVTGSYVSSTWYGVSADGACVQGYSYSSLDAINPTQRNFLPKVDFDYTPGGGAAGGDITVHDGTATNSYVPVYGLYTDAYLKCEMVYPSSELAGMANTDISSMKFYLSSPASASWGDANFQVFMTEVADATISAFAGPGTIVYEGALDGTQAEMEITFTTPYHYNGGNLLVGVYNTVEGTYKSCSFYGESVTGASVQGYSYSGLSSINPTQRNFLPKTTFTYGGGGAAGDMLFVLQNGEEVETIDFGSRPNGCWMEPFTFQLRNDGPATTVSEIDFTPTDYFTIVTPELPVQMANGEVIDIEVATGETNATAWQMVAIYGLGRTARVWDVVADPYDPAIPDVVEMAYDFGTVNDGFSYSGVPSQITPTVLHNDYTLPFPEIPEGEDAVYKFTVTTDMIINANVDETALNGKVALYTEDFNGAAGPMADNNYTGIQVGGGGAAGGAFQAMIGDEASTTTSTYFPFHTLWNYSLGENLYLASELTEAGVTTAPMTSLSWYVSSTSCTTPQNGISIWMANVSDTELTSASHLASGMTLVYTGENILPVAGEWNEFVFNQGNFAWDGQSNILVLCQRLNGSWQGSVSWQTHNPGFAAMAYDYDDYEVYNAMTTSYSMTTSSTNRANVILKGGNRENTRDVITQGFEDGLGDWTMVDCHASTGVSTSASAIHTGSNGFAFHWSTTPPQYLISPLLNGDSGVGLSFFYEQNSTYYDETFQVGYSTTSNSASAFTFGPEITATNSWAEYTNSFPAGTKYIAIKCTSNDQYYLYIDDITITTAGGGVTPPPTPGLAGMSAGPVITNLPIAPGTYYLVASAQQADYTVNINIDNMPCPAIDAEGFAFNPTPADDENEVEPASVTLRWNVPAYATGYRVIFGTSYFPEPGHPQTIMYPEDGSFTDHVLANSFTVRNLYNNNHYFWRVEFNNDACPQGVSSPVWGFTTHLNIPQNLTAVDYTVFDDEQIVLNWNPVVDRTYRYYNVYRDGALIGSTQMNNINNSTYTDGPLAYNMGGYTYYVTAVYDEGESAPSDPVTVKVAGYADVNGHVYEQDGSTGIAGATVTMVGLDEFNVNHTYTFTTNNQGYYSGHIYAGTYNGSAAKDGYQTMTEPVQGNPVVLTYNNTTSPVDYILDENFDPVCQVIAEYYPDSLDPNSPYVKVYWGCGLPGSEIIEDFETGDFSQFDWQVDPTYPWTITTQNPYEGDYCMKSGGAGVANVVSNMTVTVNIPADGLMSFFGKISCESNWDYGYFYIDGVQKGNYTGAGNWAERTFDITAGDHTFMWQYTKDGSVNSNDDCFYVDYITFYKQPAPPVPGMTYDFEDSSMQGWTSIDADGDGYGWYVASEIMSTGYGHNGSNDCVLSQSYNNSVGVLYPDNYLVSPQVQLGGVLRFYACAQDASYAAEHFGVAVSTTNTQPSSFTMLNEWTMTAKSVGEPGKPVKGSRSGRAQGNWYEYTVDLSAYSGNGYVAIRHFNCSDMFYLDVDDITIGEPGKSIARNDRSLEHYKIYRTDCYNDGPYTTENTTLLATNWPGDTIYIDVEWHDLLPGMYKWGVSCVYVGNRGELVESPINWTAPVAVNNTKGDRDITVDFEGGMPAGWTVIDANNDGYTWCLTSAIPSTWTYYASLTLDWYHSGSNAICSGSYINGAGALYPDEYFVSPQVNLGAGSEISFWVAATDASYPADHFGVFVSDNGTSNWTSVQEWTLSAKKSGLMGGVGSRDGGGLRLGTWYNYTVDLSAYAGQKYVAFRHFNCTDQYIMCLDDINIVESGSAPTPPTPGTGGTLLVNFENGQMPSNWVNDANYPWVVASPAYAGYNGSYCIMSGNGGIASSTSAIEATATFVENGSISFLGGCWGEGTSTVWDKCQFFIDGNEQFTYGALQTWDTYSFNVTAGTHTFRWSYTKDSSVNPTGDAFFVDDITFNGVAGAGGNGLQEPRESEIVWSNCLDKDMYLTVADVNVLLNSADSPEGTVVTFTNYNEAEQLAYPIAPITLDETGFYAFESFRRGAYKVTVELEGYETIVDSINFIDYPNNLLTEMHLRYVMTEILYGVGDVYVSRTGWAMWGDSNINPNPNPGPGGNASTFDVDFEGGMPEGWNVIDANGDGYTWCLTSNIPSTWSYYAGMSLDWYHNGTNAICSGSYINGVGALTPDEYLVSPQVTLAAGSQLSFWVAATDANYPADHFGVFVSDNGTSDWTAVQEWTLSGKGGAKAGDRASRDGEGLRIGTWYNYTVDLSAYAGQKYIAFRHFNCNDQYIMCLDDIALTAGAKDGDRHFEYYKVMCTSIDGVPIYNHNTVYPFCQLTTFDPNSGLPMLIEGEHYLVKVAAMYSTGMSEWSTPVEWEYEPCDHWGPVDEVAVNTTNQGNHIQWVFEHGYNPYDPGTGPVPPQPGQGEWYYYDNGVNVDAIGLTSGGSFYWGVMFPAGSYTGNMVTKVSMYDYSAHTGTILVYQGGTTAPANLVGQQAYTCTGSEDFVEWTFDNPAVIDPSQNLWIVMNNNNGQYVASMCDYTGDPNGTMISIDGTDWSTLAEATGGAITGTWMIRAYVASGAKGEPQILSYNGKSSNGGTLAISGNGPRVKVENVNFAMMSENALELNIASIANFDARVYFLCNLVNDSRFSVINSEEDGKFIVSANDNIDLKDSFVDFIERTMKGFSLMDKYAAADFAIANKGTLPMSFTNSMMMDIYAKSRDNSHCADAYPFCTDEGMYEFPAGVNAGTGESGPDYDCLYTTPNPAWYYMKMADPGDMDIYMYSTPSVDIDFCCWGPFDDPTSPCPNGLTEDKVVSCSYSAQPTEHCMIPASAQTGQYYILVITNYSNQACNINFSKVGGSGTTDCGIIPPTTVDLIGFLITQDGEYLAIVGPDEREYTDIDEYGDHEYCVRPIYPGEMTLPDHNYGWSMGCPVCNHPGGGFICEPGDPIHVENLYETDQIRIWWGVEPQPPMEEWLYYDDGENVDAIGLQSGGSFYWGIKFTAASMAPYEGCSVTKVAYFDYAAHTGTVRIYNGSNGNAPGTLIGTYNYTANGTEDWVEWDIPAVAFDNTQDLWIVMNNNSGQYVAALGNYTGDPNGTMISTDGSTWYTLEDATGGQLSGTWNLRCFVSNQAKGGEIVALEDVKNGTANGVFANAGIGYGGSFRMNRSEIVSYNVYRSDDNVDYDLIGNVPAVAGQTLYEYFDAPEAGTYYYQVTAVYEDCESYPAPSFEDPTQDYVIGICTGLDENSDNVALYPNPTNGNVTIEANGMSRITVVSVLGQVVYDTELNADQFTLNMGQFNAGMYMVRVYTEEGVTVKRVTVMQ